MITFKTKPSIRKAILDFGLYGLLLLLSLILLSAVTSCQHKELPKANAYNTSATFGNLSGLGDVALC